MALGALAAGAAVGWLAATRVLDHDECARRERGMRIPAVAACCPRCGALVRGVLGAGDDVYDALERRRQERVAARRAREKAPA